MKQTTRKLSALILSLVMIIASLPMTGITAFAEAGDRFTNGDFEYEVLSEVDKTCEITWYGGDKTSITLLTVPSDIDGYKVTSIGNSVFSTCPSLTSIVIPDSITCIKNFAFYHCPSLTSVIIPDTVTEIDFCAFGYIDAYFKARDVATPVKMDDFTIYGYNGTAAEEYAKRNEFKFISLDEPETKLGDVNGDNEIKIVDAKWILQSVAGTKNLNDTQKTAADLNKDGNVSIVDAKWVLQIVAGTRDATTLKLK